MIDHTGVGVSDFERSRAFHAAALGAIGEAKLMALGPEVTGHARVAGSDDGTFVRDPDGHDIEAVCHAAQ